MHVINQGTEAGDYLRRREAGLLGVGQVGAITAPMHLLARGPRGGPT